MKKSNFHHSKGLLLKQLKQIVLEGESLTLSILSELVGMYCKPYILILLTVCNNHQELFIVLSQVNEYTLTVNLFINH